MKEQMKIIKDANGNTEEIQYRLVEEDGHLHYSYVKFHEDNTMSFGEVNNATVSDILSVESSSFELKAACQLDWMSRVYPEAYKEVIKTMKLHNIDLGAPT